MTLDDVCPKCGCGLYAVVGGTVGRWDEAAEWLACLDCDWADEP